MNFPLANFLDHVKRLLKSWAPALELRLSPLKVLFWGPSWILGFPGKLSSVNRPPVVNFYFLTDGMQDHKMPRESCMQCSEVILKIS